MFGIGHFWELLVVVAVALLVFGPRRLPEMGEAVGKTIRSFQQSMQDPAPSAPPQPTATALPEPPSVPRPAEEARHDDAEQTITDLR